MSPIFLASLMIMGIFLFQAAIVFGIIHWISKRTQRPAQTKMYLTMSLLVVILGFLVWDNWIHSQEFNGWAMISLLVIIISAYIQLRKQKEKY
ncbi:hypothetical protein ACYCS5_02115 [Paenibacillus sp. SEL3]|jgi:uncharacterized membrane protein|uniref:Uncharacterized protein n=1 Tax=Paenibacillus polymyxa TaxID=1406 RepID=A0A8I1IUV4_PAEPO|nr:MULTISPECIES: hypothetical protein [Paenibacillus]KAF6572413.1 hypothetical protein G9G53_16605 [Paenibacillus sp. EKM206P]KAF6586824.1 hypothetical protein G9G52_19610 [Paenibacillus sp. EKM205P]MBM0635068.1 hypothetical protein [Paenibacillus polymyxa]MBO3286480.1 hypothetical protein [Paenibacillus polymyxa]ODB59149.1 hypothetical protein A7311_12555 [Paenibacillus polymyxa]